MHRALGVYEPWASSNGNYLIPQARFTTDLDVYFWMEGTEKPWKVVFFLHGFMGWFSGSGQVLSGRTCFGSWQFLGEWSGSCKRARIINKKTLKKSVWFSVPCPRQAAMATFFKRNLQYFQGGDELPWNFLGMPKWPGTKMTGPKKSAFVAILPETIAMFSFLRAIVLLSDEFVTSRCSQIATHFLVCLSKDGLWHAWPGT